MQGLFYTVPIAAADLVKILAVASLVLWVEEFRKWLHRVRDGRDLPRAGRPDPSASGA